MANLHNKCNKCIYKELSKNQIPCKLCNPLIANQNYFIEYTVEAIIKDGEKCT